MKDWTESRYLQLILIFMLLSWGFSAVWMKWHPYAASKCGVACGLLLLGYVLPMRWPRAIARVPIFVLLLNNAFLAVFFGCLVGILAKRRAVLWAGVLSAALPSVFMLLAVSPWAILPDPAWPKWRVAISLGLLTMLWLWAGSYTAMLVANKRSAQQPPSPYGSPAAGSPPRP